MKTRTKLMIALAMGLSFNQSQAYAQYLFPSVILQAGVRGTIFFNNWLSSHHRKMPKVKYPAAVIFEGGNGDPNSSSGYEPLWRFYLCLAEGKEKSGKMEIDFQKLNFPIESSMQQVNGPELIKEKLNKVQLDYDYAATTEELHIESHEYAYGQFSFNSTSQEEWQTLYQAPDYKNQGERGNFSGFFNASLNPNNLFFASTLTFQAAGQERYIVKGFQKFSYRNEEEDEAGWSEVVKPCEEADQPIVWMFGKDIPK